MSIYYNPHLMRLLNEDRLQEIIRSRSARPIEEPRRTTRRPETRLDDDRLVHASTCEVSCAA
jgi:hypothetical protein